MHLPNHPNPALHKRVHPRIVRLIAGIVSLALMALAGCSGGAPSLTGFFSGRSPLQSPTPEATATPSTTPTPVPTPAAEAQHPAKKIARPAHAAAKPSSGAAAVEGGGSHAVVSLEPNSGGAGASATPAAAASAAAAATMEGTPTLSSSSLESSGSTGDVSPAKAAKLIEDIDKVEKRVDRQSLSADDSQRDILAQKLLLEAKQSLDERDSAAAMSLANKASTLLAPLPKLADSTVPPTP
jgi:hypothetical protein